MAKYACSSQASILFTFPICRDFLYILVDNNIGRTLDRRVAY